MLSPYYLPFLQNSHLPVCTIAIKSLPLRRLCFVCIIVPPSASFCNNITHGESPLTIRGGQCPLTSHERSLYIKYRPLPRGHCFVAHFIPQYRTHRFYHLVAAAASRRSQYAAAIRCSQTRPKIREFYNFATVLPSSVFLCREQS